MIPLPAMSQLVRYEVRDRVAVLTVDNPPVNALSAGVPEAISDAVERACQDSSADAIVLIGAGTTFIAGADINVFKQLKTREQSLDAIAGTHALLKRLEDAASRSSPRFTATRSAAASSSRMACHYRVADEDAKVGQPEVLLGIIPGAGGTQRLPRLCGAELALEMCTDGKPVAAPKALGRRHHRRTSSTAICSTARSPSRRRRPRHDEIRKTREIASAAEASEPGSRRARAMRQTLAKTAKGVRGAVRRGRRHRSRR